MRINGLDAIGAVRARVEERNPAWCQATVRHAGVADGIYVRLDVVDMADRLYSVSHIFCDLDDSVARFDAIDATLDRLYRQIEDAVREAAKARR